MQLSARIERDINDLQERMEQEREELYDKLRQAKADYEERKLGQTARANSIFHTMNQSEGSACGTVAKTKSYSAGVTPMQYRGHWAMCKNILSRKSSNGIAMNKQQ